MTPTEQDKELRAKLANTKTFNYDVYFGQDIANNCIPFEESLDEILQLITADSKRVALEARIEEIVGILSRNVTSGESVKTNISIPRVLTLNERYAELKAQQEKE